MVYETLLLYLVSSASCHAGEDCWNWGRIEPRPGELHWIEIEIQAAQLAIEYAPIAKSRRSRMP